MLLAKAENVDETFGNTSQTQKEKNITRLA